VVTYEETRRIRLEHRNPFRSYEPQPHTLYCYIPHVHLDRPPMHIVILLDLLDLVLDHLPSHDCMHRDQLHHPHHGNYCSPCSSTVAHSMTYNRVVEVRVMV